MINEVEDCSGNIFIKKNRQKFCSEIAINANVHFSHNGPLNVNGNFKQLEFLSDQDKIRNYAFPRPIYAVKFGMTAREMWLENVDDNGRMDDGCLAVL